MGIYSSLMENPNRPALIRRIVVLCLLLLTCGYFYWTVDDYRAYLYSRSSHLRGLQRAVRIEPYNAGYHRLVGNYFVYSQHWQNAIDSYKRSINLNPREGRTWLDLAIPYQFIGDSSSVVKALDRAMQLAPTSADVALTAANQYLLTNHPEKALSAFRVVVANSQDDDEVRAALDRSWRATGNIDELLTQVLPSRVTTHFTLLTLTLQYGDAAAAKKVWSHLVRLRVPFDPKMAFSYIESLLKKGDTINAARAWRDMADAGLLRSYVTPGNMITNGGFEADILNGGFDWRYQPLPNVNVSITSDEVHGGSRALFAYFEGGPASGVGVAQYVAVEPNTSYEFSAFVKAQDIEGGSGPRFAISDPSGKRLSVLTDGILGSTEWQRELTRFRTDDKTDLVMVTVARTQSEAPIRGKLWIDDLKLIPVQKDGGHGGSS